MSLRSAVRRQLTGALIMISSLVLAACGGSGPAATPVPTQVKPTPSPAALRPQSGDAPEIASWLRDHALPFTINGPGSDLSDLAALEDIVGDARIVALGEATHGTREFFQIKHHILEFLVTEMDFTLFGIEASWAEANLVNDYVHTGQGDPAALLANLGFWTWNTREVLDMVEWMQAYNQTRGDAPPVSFFGFDMQVPGRAMDNVTGYLSRIDPDAGAQADALFSCIRPYQALTQAYAQLPQTARDQCRQDLQTAHDLLAQHQPEYVSRSSPAEFAQALHSARAMQQFEEVFGTGSPGFAARDRYMAENVSWLLQQAGPDEKIVVWAHNSHVGVDADGQQSMGSWLREQYGDALVTFGFTFYDGSFNAITMTGPNQFAGLAEHKVGPPAADSVESYLHAAMLPSFFLDLRAVRPGPDTNWLLEPRRLRRIGSAYDSASPEAFFVRAALAEMFDVIIYIEESHPSQLLVPRSASSPPNPPAYASQPANLGFEDSTAQWALFGTRTQDYAIGTDRTAAHRGSAGGYLRATTDTPGAFGALLQTFAADAYRGKRLRMSAYVKSEDVSAGAGVLMRIDGPGGMLAIRNMQAQPIRGTTGWARYDIVMDVPVDGVAIVFGPWLSGSGQIAFDDFEFDTVGPEVPLTP